MNAVASFGIAVVSDESILLSLRRIAARQKGVPRGLKSLCESVARVGDCMGKAWDRFL
jgi:hypothetical protein